MIIKDVIEINSASDALELHTKSSVTILIELDKAPSYVSIGTLLKENQKDLEIVVFVEWDK